MKRRAAAFLAQVMFTFFLSSGFAHGALTAAESHKIEALMQKPFGPFQGFTIVRMRDGGQIKRWFSVAFDVGGGSAKTGAVTSKGEVIAKYSIPTGKSQTPAEFIDLAADVFGVYTNHLPNARRRNVPICLAVPGPLENGMLTAAPNLHKEWINFPIAQELARSIAKKLGTGFEDGMSITVVNDAKAAGVGVADRLLKGKPGTVVVITLGTGIGAAVIVDGNLVLGAGSAGEIGHFTVVPNGRMCGCARKGKNKDKARGHLEAYVGDHGIVTTALSLLSKADRGDWAKLRELCPEPTRRTLTVKMLDQAAQAGDRVALKTWGLVGGTFARGLSYAVKVLHPDKIAFVGNVARAGDLLRAPILEAFAQEPFHEMFARYQDPKNFFIDGVTQYGLKGAAIIAWQAVTPH